MARPGRPSRVAPAALKHSKAPAAAASAGRRIDSYGRVSKRVAPSGTKTTTTALAVRPEIAERLLAEKQKEHVAIDLPLLSSAPPTKPSQPHNPSTTLTKQRKRRASEAIDADISSSSSIPEQARATATKRARRITKATTSIADLLTRSNNNNKNTKLNTTATQPLDDSDSDSPASSFGDKAGKLLARLNLQSSLASTCAFPSPPRSASSSPQPASTASTTPYQSETEAEAEAQAEALVEADVALPAELLDLVHLQAAFVKALTLHLSHHGVSTPVDVSVLCPNVAQSWGKRQVTLEDVQRCIGTATAADNSNGKGIFLCDYSRGKICIELQPDVGAVSALCAQLNKNFETVLRARWSAALRQGHGAVNTTQFIASLPRAPVTQCASLLQTSALRAKGQRSLEELMHGIALKKQERAAQDALLKAPVTAAAGAAAAAGPPAAGAPMNLLDRIRFRQLQRAQLQASGAASAAPTPEELERRAALQRAGDIAEVLTMLCAASSAVGRPQSRVSFGMTAVLTKIKDSLRVPIAREEAASCVRLLAKEVAPQWLQLVSMGGREIVIMLPNLMPSKTAIQSQVQRLS